MIPDTGMKLEKLTIYVEKKPSDPVEVLFNPNQIVIAETGWTTDSDGQLVAAKDTKTFSVELFFDTTLPQTAAGRLPAALNRATLAQRQKPDDVRKYTRPIVQLTEARGDLGKMERPPICQLLWGKLGGAQPKEGFFQGVLKSVTQTFSRFLPDGTPIRATLSCEFEEWEDPQRQAKAKNPTDDPIRVVKRGETLSSIATAEYGDPVLWRVIADENRLNHPRQLVPGQRLTVPPLRVRGQNQGGG